MTDAAEPDANPCPRCSEPHHLIACPYVKAVEMEYGGDHHSIRRVEFLTPADWGVRTARDGQTSMTEPAYPKLEPKKV